MFLLCERAGRVQFADYARESPRNGRPYHMGCPIKGGEFLMGSRETKKDATSNERPPAKLRVKKKFSPFLLGKYGYWDEYRNPFMITPVDRFKKRTAKDFRSAAKYPNVPDCGLRSAHRSF